jgi:hypothetical protein
LDIFTRGVWPLLVCRFNEISAGEPLKFAPRVPAANSIMSRPSHERASRIDAFGLFTGQVGYAWNAVLVYVKDGAAVTNDRFDILDTPTGILLASTGIKPAGAARPVLVLNLASRRIGRLASNTITCLWDRKP